MGAPGSCGSCAPAPGFGEPPGLPTIGPVSPPTTEPLPPPTIVPLSPPRPAPLEGTWALLPDGAEVPIRSTAEPGRETPGSLPATGAVESPAPTVLPPPPPQATRAAQAIVRSDSEKDRLNRSLAL